MDSEKLLRHLEESWRIEGLAYNVKWEAPEHPVRLLFTAAQDFLALEEITVPDMCALVAEIEPGALLRDKEGMDVRVGGHVAPRGGIEIATSLEHILLYVHNSTLRTPYWTHKEYETLHPFTDGNGRSGRLLWLWQMEKFHGGTELSFLHWHYYASLNAGR